MAEQKPTSNVLVGKQWFRTPQEAETYRRRLIEPSFVYFIQRGLAGAIKIGYAKDPAHRLRDLQVGADKPLMLVAVVPGGIDLERALHREFTGARLTGEWFRPVPSLLARIRELTGNTRIRRHSAGCVMDDTRPPKPKAYWIRRRQAFKDYET